ncbi:5-formyltetrahydrofolate cyclo-ligase [Nocardia sp. BSTN01]|uniref:5-formyltetrahydrofolate cyclo-ligase n=1 Tax=Nocardia sp. BSTN01 TaxID=2783665 RepID=UPI00188E2A6B|nr:5-formyltetrahydrofolate cyclo-ligase [Nocardia sp. BSTN01]MBF4996558.1 5-formyltetrahydrofolate cyclo-ligase [Nocardia sp. BSTN01]
MEIAGQRDKGRWRAELLAARAAVPPETRAAEAEALSRAVSRVLDIDRPRTDGPHSDDRRPAGGSGSEAAGSRWVAGYIPVAGEPGSVAMLDALRVAGVRVMVPVTGPPGPLGWAEYTGIEGLRRARYGLLEPEGPPLGVAAIEWPEVIVIPALAVDRRGVRLGRGAGYYDRTLPAARSDARLVAVVRDTELLDVLPEEPHDRRMGWALLPEAGLCRLDAGDREIGGRYSSV